MIYVFLSEKTLSCDAITPFLYELSDRYPKEKIVLVAFQVKTYESIVSNVVLHDAIAQIGELRLLADKFSVGLSRQIWRIKRWWFLALAIIRGVLGLATFVHFGQLNHYPRRVLFHCNAKRTYLFQASPVGLNAMEKVVDRIRYPDLVLNTNLAATALVAQNPDWDALEDPDFAHLPRHMITPPARRWIWRDYVRKSAKRQFEKFGLDVEKELVVFVLSSLDPPNMTYFEGEFVQLFERTLEVLAEEIPETPVVVKCHPATTKEYFRIIYDIVDRTPHRHVTVADLHPIMLASMAKFFISNALSTTYFFAQVYGVPVIEYTHYSPEILKATGGKATRPDLTTHFINYDEKRLRQTIGEVMAAPKHRLDHEDEPDPEYEKVMRMVARESATSPAVPADVRH